MATLEVVVDAPDPDPEAEPDDPDPVVEAADEVTRPRLKEEEAAPPFDEYKGPISCP